MSRLNVSILLVALAGAVIYAGILPQWRAIQAARAEIDRLQNLHNELLQLEEKRSALTEDYNSIPEKDLEKVRAIAPQRPETSSLLVDLEVLAQKSNLLISKVDFPPVKGTNIPSLAGGSNLYQFIPVAFRVDSGYDAFSNFLKSLERNLRLVDVTEMDLSSDKTISAEIKGRVYYRLQ